MEDLISFSFRIPKRLASATSAAARCLGMSKSEYARRAIEEFNLRVMHERIAELSRRLSTGSMAASRAMDASTGDGIE